MKKTTTKLYSDFRPPPVSKTYYPTEAEFADPIAFVESIREEASQFGVVKVVPPTAYRPPCVIDDDTFRFKTRVQPLYGIDALCRSRIFFIHEVCHLLALKILRLLFVFAAKLFHRIFLLKTRDFQPPIRKAVRSILILNFNAARYCFTLDISFVVENVLEELRTRFSMAVYKRHVHRFPRASQGKILC